ncbi:sulfite exporter TauE/SafE family protein [Atopomonas sediminilitoris]|uniref:sulfite exporter TauE/SafE family protein n=1 Tax=Atopomonas sediminilitoris TaxID=2919919 RepID=UPI001F4DC675|nr:sulfite exporter TauE/SafE family protein [Atopomonas sediminilitoris]MCJ8168461.1 sulfite exporter TauE/SafE family protein [Atopomonas sediminilitoris]
MSLSLVDLAWLLLAGGAAGAMNALAGGGTFLSFPALLAVGVPAVSANATNAVALWPASIASAWAGRRHWRSHVAVLWPLLAAALLGGVLGSGLLLLSGEALFRQLIPWLLLLATLLFTAAPWLRRLSQQRTVSGAHNSPAWLALHASGAVYGGFFGAGMGIVQLALLAVQGHDVQRASALKNLFSAVIYSVASLVFIAAGAISYHHLAVLLGATVLGGYLGGRLADRLAPQWLRVWVISVGSAMTLYYFLVA